jgi:hypothetical protein
MRWVVLFLPLIASALALPTEPPTPTPPIDPKIDFKVSIVGTRFLGTADAARELANQLRGTRSGDSVCFLASFPRPSVQLCAKRLNTRWPTRIIDRYNN